MVNNFRFRAMTYNVHLYGDAADVVGIPLGGYCEDDKRLTEFIRLVRQENPLPDVIGLNEMWDEDLIRRLQRELEDLYPYAVEGSVNSAWSIAPDPLTAIQETQGELAYLIIPFWGLWEFSQGLGRLVLSLVGAGNLIGSGLVLLSRYPIAAHQFIPYMEESGSDIYAEKGILVVAIQPPDVDATMVVILTHMQAGNQDATRGEQIGQLADIVKKIRRDNPRRAILVMGDLNVTGEYGSGNHTLEYRDMIGRLGLDDTWRHLNPDKPGLTYDFSKNDLAPIFANEGPRSRLDYILYDSDYYIRCEPLSCQLRKYRSDEGFGPEGIPDVSDHYGVLADFQIEVLPFGTITYHIDSHSGVPAPLEEAATRSLLAWMEEAKIGFRRVEPNEETPLLRVGFESPELMGTSPLIERLGRVHVNRSPSVGNAMDTWSWGFGYDSVARQLDLPYAVQHYTGLALHSLSPRSPTVERVLSPHGSDPGSVMLPYDPTRQLEPLGVREFDHRSHLTESDIDYITKLYGRRAERFDWKDKVAALRNSEVIHQILESGLSGTRGQLREQIAGIEQEIQDIKPVIPVGAEVKVCSLTWCRRGTEFWPSEDEEIVIKVEAYDGHGNPPTSLTHPRCGSVEVSQWRDTTVSINKSMTVYPIHPDHMTLNITVVEDDAWFNDWNLLFSHNRSYSKSIGLREIVDLSIGPIEIESVRSLMERLRSPGGPYRTPTVYRRIINPGAWYADVEITIFAGGVSRRRLDSLGEDLDALDGDRSVLESDFRPALAAAVNEQLAALLG